MARELFNLLYMSVATASFNPAELTNLLGECRRFNSENGITGLLLYVNGHWIEFLEGDRKTVEELMTRIERDPRHRDIEVIEQGTATAREFPQWSMAFETASPEARALPGYSTFLADPVNWESPELVGRGHQLLDYFKVIMLASDDSVLNLAQSAEIRQKAPALAGKLAAAKRRS